MIEKELLESYPTLEYVESSNIIGVSYNPGTKELYVMFGNRKLYKYDNVSKNVYKEFIQAPSSGKYMHEVIRPYFKCKKVDVSTIYVYVDTISNKKVVLTEIDRERNYCLLDGEKYTLNIEVK